MAVRYLNSGGVSVSGTSTAGTTNQIMKFDDWVELQAQSVKAAKAVKRYKRMQLQSS